MATKDLNLTHRTQRAKTGTTGAQALRRDGKIPGVIYGHGTEPCTSPSKRKFSTICCITAAVTASITLTARRAKAETALVREIQRNPVSRKVVHVDLQRVSATRGGARDDPIGHGRRPARRPGLRRRDGRDRARSSKSKARSINFPSTSKSTSRDLGIHQHIIAGDIKLPAGFKLLEAPDMLVVSIEASRTEKTLEEAAAGATTEQADARGYRRDAGERNTIGEQARPSSSSGWGTPEKSTSEPGTTPGSWLSTKWRALRSFRGRPKTAPDRSSTRAGASCWSNQRRS